jgi:hypothetical protein
MLTTKTIEVITDGVRINVTNIHSLVTAESTLDALIDLTIDAPEANVSMRLKAKQVSALIDALRYVRYE